MASDDDIEEGRRKQEEGKAQEAQGLRDKANEVEGVSTGIFG